MNNRYQNLILISFILVSIISCGGGGGAPGSDPNDTAIMIKSALLSMTSTDVDTLQDCCSVDATTGLCSAIEDFTRADATLAVETTNLSPTITSDHFPAKVQECTITYIKSNEDPAAPIIEAMTIYPSCTLNEGQNSCGITIMDITRKNQYSTPVYITGISSPAERPTHYVGRVSCIYTNNFGKTGSFDATIDLWLSDFDNC